MGTIYRRHGKIWQAEFTDHNGKRVQKSTRTTDKKTAKQILAKWEHESAQRAAGLIDPELERLRDQAAKSIEEHFKDWLKVLENQNRSKDHVQTAEKRWNAIVRHVGWRTLADISPEGLEDFCNQLRKSGRYKNSKDRSAATGNRYIQTAKGFCNWLVKTKRIKYSPLLPVESSNEQLDRRLRRRFLLPDEWPWLKKATEETELQIGVPSEVRELLYETAIQTGYRANELRELEVHNFEYGGKRGSLWLQADQTKGKKRSQQSISKQLSKRLAKFCKGRSGDSPIFTPLCHNSNMADMVRADLAVARKLWLEEQGNDKAVKSDFLAAKNFAGEGMDFHALRHTCGAWLACKNVHPKSIQAVMRHSTITLTFDTYGHLMPNSIEGAIDVLAEYLDE